MSSSHAGTQRVSSKPSRAERRAAQRREQHRPRPSRRGPSLFTVLGSTLTVLAVVAILGYAAMRQRANSTPNALTDAAMLNPASSLLPVGRIAPHFTLKDASGHSYNLAAQRGHPVLLEFYAVWCPVCHGEAPIMERIAQKYVPKGARVWAVLANPYGRNYEISGRTDLHLATANDTRWYKRTYGATYPQLIDPNFRTVNTYGARSYPGLYVVDKDGFVRFATAGHTPYSKLSHELDRSFKSMDW